MIEFIRMFMTDAETFGKVLVMAGFVYLFFFKNNKKRNDV
ncbi:hypothetical protein BpsS36_00037 [Bacillus phage vB_BpsS-36]|uniref:Uncharacterized protein n=1 Tax=Bacillus phage vB_BpsS-36 TaxID=2419622 RepID=A0A3G3BWS4_9CAUD|nr:hypothetical protein BpsS36_00037 [Bacillus phage vB_BpsS-36]